MLTEGSLLQGRYRVVRLLSRGGMGAVYEAMDERLGSTVALKESFFDEPRMKQQFESEARMLARLRHPALTKVIDHFSEDDKQFLVMEYIAGNDFGEELKKRNAGYPVEHVLLWLGQLLDALDYIHTQTPPIIHRDIKPQNLKLTSRSQIILLDFGLAKNTPADGGSTTTASVFGYTPHYAALEQIQGSGTDPRSDLYSLAATAYHLMTGTRPPDALSRAAATLSGEQDPLVAADQITTSVPPAIASVLSRAMALNRNDRYPSASEMHRALRDAASSAGVTFARMGASGATVVAATAPTITNEPKPEAPTVQSRPGAAAATLADPAPERKKPRVLLLIGAAVVLLFLGAIGIRFYRAWGDHRTVVSAGVTGAVTQPSTTSVDVAATPKPAEPPVTPAAVPAASDLPGETQLEALVALKSGDSLVGGAGDGTLVLVRGNTTTVATKFGGNVRSIAVAPDEKSVFVAVGYDPKIGSPVYRVPFDGEKLGEPQMVVNAPAGPIGAMAISPDGRFIALGLSSRVRLFDLLTKSFTHDYEGHTNAVQVLAFFPDGSKLVSGSLDGTVRVWSGTGNVKSDVLDGRGNGVLALAVSHDGRYIASAGYDGAIYVWGGTYGSLVRTLPGNTMSVSALMFDGDRLISATANGAITSFKVDTWEQVASIKATGLQLLSAVAVRPDHVLAVAQGDGKLVFVKMPE